MSRTERAHLRHLLVEGEGALYAVLDAARSPRVSILVRASGEPSQSLYEGAKGAALAPWGPLLVELGPESRLLDSLLGEGWGESWGLFLRSPAGFRHVRRHFRRLLIVQSEAGKKLYFRFYDPRVMRTFLPIATERQLAALFDEVDSYWMESADAEALSCFRHDGGALVATQLGGPD